MRQTVVLLDESAAGTADLLVELSKQGMLRDVVIVDSLCDSALLSEGQLQQINLADFLANRQLSLVRAFRLSLDGSPISDGHLEVVASLNQTLPPVGVEVELASIVLPLDGSLVSPAAFPQYWNYNLLVQPVDMAGESGFAILPLTDSRKQVAVATATLALCGALWRWLEEGPLDGGRFRLGDGGSAIPHDAAITTARVRIIRSATRMIDAGDITAQAVAWALSPGVQFPPPAGCARHGDAKQACIELAAQIAPKRGKSYFGFTYQPLDLPAPPSQKRLRPWAAIAAFLSEFWRELRKIPREKAQAQWDRMKRAVEDAVSNHTFGPDSDIKVSFSRADSAAYAVDPASRSEAVSSLPNVKATPPAPTPQTWSMLMAVVLSAADGSDLPTASGVQAPTWSNQRAVVTDFAAIVHPSSATGDQAKFVISVAEAAMLGWTTDDELIVGGGDVGAAQAILKRIELPAGPAPDTLPPPVASQSGAAESGGPDGLTQGSTATEAAARSLPAGGTLPNELKDLQSRLRVWVSARDSTLVWRIGQSLMEQQNLALADLGKTSDQLEQIFDAMKDSEATEKKQRKRFIRKAVVLVVFTLLLAVAFVWLVLIAAFIALLPGVIGLVIGLLGSIYAMVRLGARRVRERHRIDQLANRPGRLWLERQQAADEYVRLASLYIQLQDWSEIIAITLHRPLGTIEHHGEKPWATTLGALSFVSGVPKLDEGRVRATTLSVLQHLATRGWLSRAFERQRGYVIEEYSTIAGGIVATDTRPEADNSVDQDVLARLPGAGGRAEVVVYPPRANLRRAFSEGKLAARYRSEQVDAMHQSALATDPFGMIESITCDIVGLNEPKRTPQEFLAPIVEWTAVPTFDSLLAPIRRLAGVAVGSVVGISDSIEATMLPKELASVAVAPLNNRFTLAAFRLDVSEAINLEDIEIIDNSRQLDATSPPAPSSPADHEPYG